MTWTRFLLLICRKEGGGRDERLWVVLDAVLEFQIYLFVRATEALEPGPFFALCICRRREYGFHLLPPVCGGVAFGVTAASFLCAKSAENGSLAKSGRLFPESPGRFGFLPLGA